jgi:hypothetical protein
VIRGWRQHGNMKLLGFKDTVPVDTEQHGAAQVHRNTRANSKGLESVKLRICKTIVPRD